MEVPDRVIKNLLKIAREALEKKSAEHPSLPGSEEASCTAEVLHDCNLLIRLASQLADWKEKHAQRMHAMDEMQELESYMEDSLWDGVDKPEVLLLSVYFFQTKTVIALGLEEETILSDINRKLKACKVFFSGREERMIGVVANNERFAAKIIKALEIAADYATCPEWNEDLVNELYSLSREAAAAYIP
ncbi:uncharacterized protein A1O5_10023 [Cladophialophora psammophila CBS 110553]|uniref:Uncharacterized protein n=1 Tax=Cladophialophora psammophila CBS 110553 TaxID=1182543 RepID=W9WFY9_9EURO|nr:uncharacterized protein A1O5_10023 [Cladophialophora psammophila CBS 110553]EXJ66828.1 hypothetical protein A1O5_10023 [Cladophialophora psammophila CBS 110553]